MGRDPFAPWPEARILGAPAAWLAAGIAASMLGVAVFFGAIRVLPVLLAPSVPLALAGPLARGVLEVGLEIALLVAPPIACALAAARLVDRGDARALAAMGARPARIVLGALPAAALLALAAGLAATAWGRDAAAPGRLAREMLFEARASCAARAPPAAVDVPFLGFSWVCLPGAKPRAVGVAPLGSTPAWFAASTVELADDLRSLRLGNLELVIPDPAGLSPPTHVAVAEASIAGVAPLGRASNLGALRRGALMSATALLLALLAALVVIARSIASPAVAIAVGLAGPSAALGVFSMLERAATAQLAYLSVPLAGAAALGLSFVLAGAIRPRGHA